MPSELTTSVQNAIQSFISVKTSEDHGYIASDILRTIRDESILMMEYQTICDTFDLDPLNLYEDDENNLTRLQIARLKTIMKVISFSRTITKANSSIETVVELKKDNKMKNVNNSLRLTFSFERNQILIDQNNNNMIKENESEMDDSNEEHDRNMNKPKYGTNITYSIDVSKDYMQKERLIDINVEATGTSPSIQPAEPFDDEPMVEEFDDKGNPIIIHNDKSEENNTDDIDGISSSDDNAPDQFAAYCDPDVLEKFLKWSGLKLDAQNVIFLLMTFPYYEHEWDIFGFLLDCVFGGDEDQDDESMETVDDDDQ